MPGEFRRAVEALVAAYLAAYRAEDAAGCAATFSPDAVLHSPFGPAVVGRAWIAEEHAAWFAEREEEKRLEVVECARDGALGYALLSWSARVPGPAAPDGTGPRRGGVTLAVLDLSGPRPLFHRMALVPDPD